MSYIYPGPIPPPPTLDPNVWVDSSNSNFQKIEQIKSDVEQELKRTRAELELARAAMDSRWHSRLMYEALWKKHERLRAVTIRLADSVRSAHQIFRSPAYEAALQEYENWLKE